MAIYDDLRTAINEAASKLGANGSEFKSSNVREWLVEHKQEEWPRFEPSFQVHFSFAVNSDSRCIVERVPGKFLYRSIVKPAESPENANEPGSSNVPKEPVVANPDVKVKSQREAKLYQVLREWLESKGYQAAITSSSKSGGTWGNPDVTGLRLDELPIGPAGLECATIEAKLNSDLWRYFIFEAVAHKRFAHRAWFAFAVGTDSPSVGQIKDAEQMSQYAEKYRIGVLVVFISSRQYEQLAKGDSASLILGPDDVRIEVLWPAAYEHVHIPVFSEFVMDILGVKNHNDLGMFGRQY